MPTEFEEFISLELSRKLSIASAEVDAFLPPGFALRTKGIGTQCSLVPFPSVGIQAFWDMAADPNIPTGGGAGSMYEITGGPATRSGEDFNDLDIAIILSDGTTSRNLTNFMAPGAAGGDPLTGWASYTDTTHTIGLPFNVTTGDGIKS